MLVLSRQRNEQVVIGTGDTAVTVTVIEIRGDKVRLGFAAPRETRIDRAEVAERRETEDA